MEKRIHLSILIFFSFTSAFTQSYKYIYYLDKDLSSVDSSSALFIGKGMKDNNFFLLDCFKKQSGKLFMSAHFTDSTVSVLDGGFKSFYDNDSEEQTGNYSNGVEEGLWISRDSLGRIKDSVEYQKGSVILKRSYRYYSNGNLESYRISNGLGLEQLFKLYDPSGTIIQTDTDDKIFTKTEVPAEFPGGSKAWGDFLKQNLKVPDPSIYNTPSGTFTVVVRFIVYKEGYISDIVAETNVGYGMEQEVIRLITSSKNWIPAKQNGYIVKSYKRQPVTFYIDNGDVKKN